MVPAEIMFRYSLAASTMLLISRRLEVQRRTPPLKASYCRPETDYAHQKMYMVGLTITMAGRKASLGRRDDGERLYGSYLVKVERGRMGHTSVASARGISLGTCGLFHRQHANGETELLPPGIR